MDQFSHDLSIALEETSLLDLTRTNRWGQHRRRTRSTGNLPCAPQPTEDSSSPTDVIQSLGVHPTTNNDGLDIDAQNIYLPSDSDDKGDISSKPSLPCKLLNSAVRLGTLESDSLNENFSPSRFFKPIARRRRKLKRISMDFEINTTSNLENSGSAVMTGSTSGANMIASLPYSTGTIRKRVLKPDTSSRLQFFCGKRKRSNRERYHEHDQSSFSMPRYNSFTDEYRMRPRSYSSTSKPNSDRLLPLNKGLLSKIERISQKHQKISCKPSTFPTKNIELTSTISIANRHDHTHDSLNVTIEQTEPIILNKVVRNEFSIGQLGLLETPLKLQEHSQKYINESNLRITNRKKQCDEINNIQPNNSHSHSSNLHNNNRNRHNHHYHNDDIFKFAENPQSMDCEVLNNFSSSSLSSSESDIGTTRNDTDREGDDELTDWPGNEAVFGDGKFDIKRKLTKRSILPQIKSDPESLSAIMTGEDDTIMSGSSIVGGGGGGITFGVSGIKLPIVCTIDLPYTSSEPIMITTKSNSIGSVCRNGLEVTSNDDVVKQIESEMSGETSNPFLASPPYQSFENREIRAGCRRIKGERPGFSIKTSVNERLSRFLQDSQQIQIRLPDIEIYEQDSLINLATLYSLQMSLENGCTILNKTSNTTQSVNIDQQNLQSRLLLSDYKRRCYENKNNDLLNK